MSESTNGVIPGADARDGGTDDARGGRFHPTRAGIINLWDYRDEEFVFADGRLVLRGPNGSGKTKALEVLFPFVLDGRIEPRRLNPFASEERTMKSNLLYRGQDSAYSYVWMEFRRGGTSRCGPTRYDDVPGDARYVTVGVGLRATRQNERVTRWYFVADGRVGVDFSLLSADDRPLTKKELTAQLGPDALTDRSTEHRAAVDERLFGLGSERFEQLLTLVLTLRRPQLAKNLDPKRLSQALTDGLRPLDGDLIAEAARSFADMESVQQTLANVAEADDAARGFLTDYTTYLRTHARAAADRLSSRLAEVHEAATALDDAWRERVEAQRERAAADDEKRDAGRELDGLQARLESLRASPGYRDREQLNQQAALVAELADMAAAAATRAEKAGAQSKRRREQADAAEQALDRAQAELSRCSDAAIAAASDAGIEWTGADGDEPDARTRAQARAEARSADVAAVRAALATLETMRLARDSAREQCEAAEHAETTAQEEMTAADAALAEAREQLIAALGHWAQQHRTVLDEVVLDEVDVSDAEPIVDALTSLVPEIGAGSSETLGSRFDALAADTVERAHAHIARTGEQADRVAAGLDELRETREAVAAEADDAPPAFAARTAERTGRDGAPLWRLVRFADAVSEEDAAGIEAALHAANLLDAWVAPEDGDQVPESDTVLVPLAVGARPHGETLDAVLAPDDPAEVSAERVAAILASIRFDSDVVAGPGVDSAAAPTVSASGRFHSGLQLGSHHAPAAQYIGASARARRRARRLADLDAEIAATDESLAGLRESIERQRTWLRRLAATREALPATAEMVRHHKNVDQAAGRLAATRSAASDARGRLDRATAAVSSAESAAHRAATERALPIEAAELDGVAAAIDSFRRWAAELFSAHNAVTERQRQHAEAAEELAAAEAAEAERRLEAESAADDQARRQSELDTLREAVGASAEQVDADIAETSGLITECKRRGQRAEARVVEAARRDGVAEQSTAAAGSRLEQGMVECQREALGLRPFAAAEVRESLGMDDELAWPSTEHAWPDPAAAADAATREHGEDSSYLPAPIPGAVQRLHEAVLAATSELKPSEASLKSSSTRVSGALDRLQARLSAAGHDYRPEWDNPDGIIVVRVADEDGFTSIGRFAERIAAARRDQEQLLTESERRILEDALLGRLAQQIHTRTLQARDLIGQMAREMKRRRMSSGAAVGITWVLADDVDDDQRRASALMDRDAARLGSDDLAQLRAHFARRIADLRAARPDRSYTDVLAEALDYRRWRTFQLTLTAPDGGTERLTKARHSTLSGGEQSVSLHLPLFAAAHVMLASARADAPRLVAMDEAFAGIDDAGRGELLGLTVDFELDLFMTGHDLWATYASVPGCAHYDLQSSAVEHTVSSLLLAWDGGELVADGPQADLAAALGSPGTRRAVREDEPMLETS